MRRVYTLSPPPPHRLACTPCHRRREAPAVSGMRRVYTLSSPLAAQAGLLGYWPHESGHRPVLSVLVLLPRKKHCGEYPEVQYVHSGRSSCIRQPSASGAWVFNRVRSPGGFSSWCGARPGRLCERWLCSQAPTAFPGMMYDAVRLASSLHICIRAIVLAEELNPARVTRNVRCFVRLPLVADMSTRFNPARVNARYIKLRVTLPGYGLSS